MDLLVYNASFVGRTNPPCGKRCVSLKLLQSSCNWIHQLYPSMVYKNFLYVYILFFLRMHTCFVVGVVDDIKPLTEDKFVFVFSCVWFSAPGVNVCTVNQTTHCLCIVISQLCATCRCFGRKFDQLTRGWWLFPVQATIWLSLWSKERITEIVFLCG